MTNGPRSPRTFLCREHLWVTLESTASELGIPMDDVIEKAMIAYANTRKPTNDEPAAHAADTPEAKAAPSPPPQPRLPAPNTNPAGSVSPPIGSSSVPPPSQPIRTPLPPIAHTTRAVPPPPRRPSILPPPARKSPTPMATPGAPATTSTPPRAVTPGPAPRAVPRATRLVLTHRGQTYEVDKDRFVLGRSKANADLRLPDANVSRQHAAIERDGASWFLVDLGSTNGVTLSGEHVSRHAIADGDVIAITTHEIHCSIR